ncbi:MAG: VOC family protein [Bdellovibrionales bacterium]
METLKATTAFYDVQNMDRAVQFYTEKLGFPLKVRFGDNWAEVDAGSISIGLHPTEDGAPVSTDGGATVSFAVEDLEKVVSHLKERGVEVGEIRTPPRGKFAMVKDSEGNYLHMIEFEKKWKTENSYRAGAKE